MNQLYPFQEIGVARLLKGNHILAFEPGLGKTPTTARALTSLIEKGNILIVCPALVRNNWASELQKWGGVDEKDIGLIDTGLRKGMSEKKEAEWHDRLYRKVIITSYNLMGKLVYPNYFNVVVFDEFHRLKNALTNSYDVAKELIRVNKPEYVWGLSGTPIPNEVKDLWSQLDLLWPERFGTYWQFCAKYCILETNEYGTLARGANQEALPELLQRLDPLMHRVTKSEVASFLPPLNCRTIYLANNQPKLKAVQEWLEEAPRPAVVLTHTRAQAKQLAELYGRPLRRFITGEQPIAERLAKIDQAFKAKDVIFATMHSVEEGINNLAAFPAALFYDLYWRPKTMIQVIGRFSRLNSPTDRGANIDMFVRKGTVDERLVRVVIEKVENINSLLKAGQGESALEEGLRRMGQTEEEFKADLLATFSKEIDFSEEY